jgi:hypothetical protein
MLWFGNKKKNGLLHFSYRKINHLDLAEFHNSHHAKDPENDVLINRKNKLKTVKITQIIQSNKYFCMTYKEVENSTEQTVHGLLK